MKVKFAKSGSRERYLNFGHATTVEGAVVAKDGASATPVAVVQMLSVDPTPSNSDVPDILYLAPWVQRLKELVKSNRSYTLDDAEVALNMSVQLYAITKSLKAYYKYLTYIADDIDAANSTLGTQPLCYGNISGASDTVIDTVHSLITKFESAVKTVGIPQNWKRNVDKVIGFKRVYEKGQNIVYLNLIGTALLPHPTDLGWTVAQLNPYDSASAVKVIESFSDLLADIYQAIGNSRVSQILADLHTIGVMQYSVADEISSMDDMKLMCANMANMSQVVQSTSPTLNWENPDPIHSDPSGDEQTFTVYTYNNSDEVDLDVFTCVGASVDDTPQTQPDSNAWTRNYIIVVNQAQSEQQGGQSSVNTFQSNQYLPVTAAETGDVTIFARQFMYSKPDLFPSHYERVQFTSVTGDSTWQYYYQVVADNYAVWKLSRSTIRANFQLRAIESLMYLEWKTHSKADKSENKNENKSKSENGK